MADGNESNTGARVTQMSPTSGLFTGGTQVTIQGTGLGATVNVLFGNAGAVPSNVTDTEVVVNTPPVRSPETCPVQLVIPGRAAVPAGTFTYYGPTVTGMSPARGPISGGTEVVLEGSGLGTTNAVLFDKTGAALVNVTDTAVTVTTPQVSPAKAVQVFVNLPAGQVSPPELFVYYVPAPVNVLFVIDNQTGVPDADVHVKFLGAQINQQPLAQTYGDDQPLKLGADTSSRSYTLAEMTAQVAGAPGLPSPVPVFRINDYSGGRIYFSLGVPLLSSTIPAAQNPGTADFTTVYGYVEPSVFPSVSAGNTNIDASYVDFVGIPVRIAIRKRADGSLVPLANNPLNTPGGLPVFDALTKDQNVPVATSVAADTLVPPGSATPQYAIGGTARILSPSTYEPALITGATAYHDWTALLAALRTAGTELTVASYTTVVASPGIPASTLFGFSGSQASNIGAAWARGQSYGLTAKAVADLNPGGTNPRILALEGVSGIVLSGTGHSSTGDSVGRFAIYLKDTDLNAPAGIYGANPPYVVDWLDAPGAASAYPQDGIQNDLSGRVVGDLLAGFNFGWAGCDVAIAGHATATGTSANLAGTPFDPTTGTLGSKQIGQLTTGEFFYLLSLQRSTADIAQWFGERIQPLQPSYYNNYASDFQALTNCYNMAFTDRLQGPSDPDLFFSPSDEIYVQITLWPGAYSVKKSS